MTSRTVKTTVALMLGLVLAWQGVLATPGGVTTSMVKKGCCQISCELAHCPTRICCVTSATPSAPVAPASLPANAQSKLQALVVSIVSLLASPSPFSDRPLVCAVSSAPVTAMPLFQRDCCYLI